MNELLGLPYSPWTEKARWALDARQVPYRYRLYQPIIGEPALRLKTRRLHGTASVPVMTDEQGRVHDDSAKIARYADTLGAGPTLFPREHEAAIARWIELSERGLAAGRALALERQLRDDAALTEMVPRVLRHSLGRFAPRLAALGVRRSLHKYRAHTRSSEQHRDELRAVLDELRGALFGSRAPTPGSTARSASSPQTLLGSFSFADIAAAQVLGFVSPPAFGMKLGKATARGFTDPEFAVAYADLVAWRDALYEAYRPK